MGAKKNRLGEKKMMKCGSIGTIVEYNDAQNIKVKFEETDNVVSTQYSSFQKGIVRNPLSLDIYGVACLGNTKSYENGHRKKSYTTWLGMLHRCYSKKQAERTPSYVGCRVCDEWLCYETFEKWYNENYYEVQGEVVCLDKDILVRNNKIYSPNTCVFIPNSINVFISKGNLINKSSNLPTGIYIQNGKYAVQISKHNKSCWVGCYDTLEEAICSHQKAKLEHLRILINKYKEYIPNKAYDSLYNWEF